MKNMKFKPVRMATNAIVGTAMVGAIGQGAAGVTGPASGIAGTIPTMASIGVMGQAARDSGLVGIRKSKKLHFGAK